MNVTGRIYAVAAVMAAGLFASAASADVIADYKVVDGGIPKSLTGKPGDAVAGKKTFIDRKRGNCLACHTAPIPEQQFHGMIGPAMEGVAERMTEAEMRLRLVDSKQVNPDTSMPAFHRIAGLNRVPKKFADKPILTAQEVEDVLAYIKTLK